MPDGKRGPTPILPPVISHPHSEAASITGGYVYNGKRMPALVGAYVYGDWVTGKIWGLRYNGKKVTWRRELASSGMQVICFGEDNKGELLVMDFRGDIYELEPNPNPDTSAQFPQKLSQTGLFSSVSESRPAPGVIPYSINAELWADQASAQRFVALPGASHLEATNDNWRFPKDTVLAKTLSLQTEPGTAGHIRHIETQIAALGRERGETEA